MDKMDALIDAYIDHSIDDAQFETLCDWLREDAEHRQIFARRLATHSAIAEWCTERSGAVLAKAQAEPEQAQTTSWIDELSNVSEQADATASPQLASVAGYALRKTLTSRFAYQAYAAAAVLLLGVTLFFVFTGNDDTENNPADFVSAQGEPGRDGPAHNQATAPIVATLTAELDAQWAEGALAPGSQLRTGQTLTLTQSFAEITTARGAVAILEAPATIEFTDSDNAIRLHAGKLVGICETESSKGFVVHTPSARITDIGTAFGVEVMPDSTTQVQVYEGEVHAEGAATVTTNQPPMVLLIDQAAMIQPNTQPERIAFEPERFKQALAIARPANKRQLNNVTWLGTPPTDLRRGVQESDALQVFAEHEGLSLTQDVPISLAHPDRKQGKTVTPGERVDVYLLHFDPVNTNDKDVIGTFTIRFDRPIVGVIGYQSDFTRSDRIFRRANANAPDKTAGMEANSKDRMQIAADGQTLYLTLLVGGPSIDQLRVLVQPEDADE